MPGTLVHRAAGEGSGPSVLATRREPLRVGAEAKLVDGRWTVARAIMSRSARILMEGWVRVPADSF
ncbi:2-methylaconitate cis-trans isomerase PrpF family protein [Rhizorhabdus wittichii]|uniref:2-methylaconitate cis-trans isomerase PrpF family protein n=1 Tax=Rhizorhabdus wittichii TaxID=160791 RepID=UPI0021F834CA|nr:2-methylaconitate cis-trans isomerase PrpF family protein [Rhizorhabdus wittichii]